MRILVGSAYMYAGKAMSGCGIEVKIAHSAALTLETFLDVRTSATANPSGILCTASDMLMNWSVEKIDE